MLEALDSDDDTEENGDTSGEYLPIYLTKKTHSRSLPDFPSAEGAVTSTSRDPCPDRDRPLRMWLGSYFAAVLVHSLVRDLVQATLDTRDLIAPKPAARGKVIGDERQHNETGVEKNGVSPTLARPGRLITPMAR